MLRSWHFNRAIPPQKFPFHLSFALVGAPPRARAFYFDAIDAFLNLPQAIKAATNDTKILKPMTDSSPLETWKMVAHTMRAIIHKAAQGVSCGLMRSNDGSIKPMAPDKSITPRSLTINAGSCPVHGIVVDISSMGWNFITAPIIKRAANITCATQRVMWIAFEDFCWLVMLWYFSINETKVIIVSVLRWSGFLNPDLSETPSHSMPDFARPTDHPGGQSDLFYICSCPWFLCSLSDCSFIDKGQNIMITGATGCGKSFLATAIGQQACSLGYKVLYISMPQLADQLIMR